MIGSETKVPGARALVITGPTAVGKSELAVRVAERSNAEIVSADSRQVYRGMEIGTAKASPELRARVPHHGLDLVAPDERYSAGRFARDAWRWIREIEGRGRFAIVVGGTGFFIRALLDPLAPEPDFDEERRDRLREHLDRMDVPELRCWLARLDPARAAELRDEGGAQRFSRSLEVVLLSGRPHSWWLEQPPRTPALDARVVCLHRSREHLYQRIDRRLEGMMRAGLLDETRRLLDRCGPDAPGLQAVGYRQMVEHLIGRSTLDEAVAEAKRATRHYARRQLTWFRHQLPPDAVWLDAERPPQRLVSAMEDLWSGSARPGSGPG